MQWLAWPAWLWPGVSGTVGETTLTVEQLARHTHVSHTGNNLDNVNAGIITVASFIQGGTTSWTGSSASHTHSLSGSSGTADILPPYYALALIMHIA